MKRTDVCVGCGVEFEQELKQGRPRTFCETCRPVKAAAAPKAAPIVPGLRADPPVRSDGSCIVCLKERKITKEARKYAGPQLDLDPFCSTQCCKKWHGVEFAVEGTDEQVDAGRNRAAAFRADHPMRDAA